ncbi:UNVERIFIED_CONTAM: hypothetical protein FKN15_037837 [Acipenser sinensis]
MCPIAWRSLVRVQAIPGASGLACKLLRAALSSNAVALGGCMLLNVARTLFEKPFSYPSNFKSGNCCWDKSS